MALGLDPNTDKDEDFAAVKQFLLSVRPGVTTIDAANYINDAIAGKIILGQGWSGDVRRIVQARKKQGDITARAAQRYVGDLGRQLVHPGRGTPSGRRARLDQLAAHARRRGHGDGVPQLPHPDPDRRRHAAG